MTTRHHISIRLKTILELPAYKLDGLIELNDVPLPSNQARALARSFMKDGKIFLPVCDNPNPDGSCAGHEVEEAITE